MVPNPLAMQRAKILHTPALRLPRSNKTASAKNNAVTGKNKINVRTNTAAYSIVAATAPNTMLTVPAIAHSTASTGRGRRTQRDGCTRPHSGHTLPFNPAWL